MSVIDDLLQQIATIPDRVLEVIVSSATEGLTDKNDLALNEETNDILNQGSLLSQQPRDLIADQRIFEEMLNDISKTLSSSQQAASPLFDLPELGKKESPEKDWVSQLPEIDKGEMAMPLSVPQPDQSQYPPPSQQDLMTNAMLLERTGPGEISEKPSGAISSRADPNALSNPLSSLQGTRDIADISGSIHSQMLDTLEDPQGGTANDFLARIADGIETLVEIMRGGSRTSPMESNPPMEERGTLGWNLMAGAADAPEIGSPSISQSGRSGSEPEWRSSPPPVRNGDWRRNPPPVRRNMDDDD